MAEKDVEIKLGLSGAVATKASLKSVEGAFDNITKRLGQAADSTKKSHPAFSRVMESLGGVAKSAQAAAPKIAMMITVLGGAAQAAAVLAKGAIAVNVALSTLAVALNRVGQEGSAVSATASAFEAMASPELLGRLRTATGGVVSDLQLMQYSARALRTNMGSEGEIVQWFETVRRGARGVGMDTEHAFERLAGAMAGDELSVFEDMGVNVTAIEDRLEAMGVQAESATGRMQVLRAAVEQVNSRFGVGGAELQTYGSMFTQITTIVQNFANEVSRAFAEDPRIVEWLQPFRDSLQENIPQAQAWAERLVDLAISVGSALQRTAESLIPMAQAFLRVSQAGMFFAAALNPQIRALYEAADLGVDALDELGFALAGTRNVTRTATQSTGEYSRSLTMAEASARELDDEQRDAERVFQALERQLHRTTDAIDTSSDSSRTAAPIVERFGETIRIVGNQSLTASTSVGNYRLSVSALAQTIREDALPALTNMGTAIRLNEEERRGIQRDREQAFAEDIQAMIHGSAISAGMTDEEIQRQLEAGMTIMDAELAHIQEMDRLDAQEAAQRRARGQEAAQRAAQIQAGFLAKELESFAAQRDAYADMAREREEIQAGYLAKELETQAAQRAAYEETERLQRESIDRRREMTEALYAKDQELEAQRFERIEGVISTARSMADATRDLFGEISSAMEAMGVSAERRKKAEGAFIIAYSSVMAILEVAEAIKSFAKEDYAAGALHVIATAKYIAAAVAASAQLGGGSAKAAPASASFIAADRSPIKSQGTGEGRTIVNQYSLGRRNGDLGGSLERAQWERQRQGGRSLQPAGVSYS